MDRGEKFRYHVETYQRVQMFHGGDEETSVKTETCSHTHVLRLEHHSLCEQVTLTVIKTDDHSVYGKRTEWYKLSVYGKGIE